MTTHGTRWSPVLVALSLLVLCVFGIALGSAVTVAAESFGAEVTSGELMAATRMHYTLRRTDERAGTVHVHFPRVGFVLKAANP